MTIGAGLIEQADVALYQAKRSGNIQCVFLVLLLLVSAGTLQLDVKTIREPPRPINGKLPRPVGVAGEDGLAYIAIASSRQCNQPAGEVIDPIGPDERHSVMLAFLVGQAQQFAQVQIALAVLAQQHQPGNMIGVLRCADKNIGADDWLDACRFGRLVELDQRKKVMLVSDSDRWHSQFAGSVDQRLNSHRTVNQRIFGM